MTERVAETRRSRYRCTPVPEIILPMAQIAFDTPRLSFVAVVGALQLEAGVA